MTKDELVAAARDAAARHGDTRLTFLEFRRITGFTQVAVYAHFESWRDLCEAAGLVPTNWTARVPDQLVFAAMRDAFLACGGIPSRRIFLRAFRYSATVLKRRFRDWPAALEKFRDWARAHDPSFPYLDALAGPAPGRRAAPPRAAGSGPPWKAKGGRPCGDLIAFRALARAPVNEGGVVLAFGMVADELGFSIDTVGAAFPDCAAKRRVGDGRWEDVRIEFEFRSRNFHDHAHDPAGCDLIVCWEHDWPDCPVEVLELRAAIASLRGGGL